MSSRAASRFAPVPDGHVAAELHARKPAPARRDVYFFAELATVALATASGLLSATGARTFYAALITSFVAIAGAVLAGAALVTVVAATGATRLQGPRRRPALMLRGARDTALAAWIAACFAAWPLARMHAGLPTGLTWSLAAAGGGASVAWQTLAAVVVLDAWLYWKHRLLHTRALFGFHRAHHVYRDPTAFAGFAVGPIESVLTFWPIVLVSIPQAVHYAPVYFALVGAFIVLNFYLHCGVVSRLLELTLPRLLVNSSAFHNRHHANAEVNFGEALTLWDRLLGTREGPSRR
jgi:sterol desaturase/sphingolipid hydroxylase (fatty acid hydroxylase superfamily)